TGTMVLFVVHLLPVPEKVAAALAALNPHVGSLVFIIFRVITQSDPFCLNPPPALRLGLYLNHNSVE
ncbi:hypothetical protein, partial [Aeromonas caviae]|uniref:hypothetical protein n=1 Tax=Aeromonas caviae TaxID=648 RepID=UPI0029DB4509